MIDLFPAQNVYKETMEGAYGGLLVRFNDRYWTTDPLHNTKRI